MSSCHITPWYIVNTVLDDNCNMRVTNVTKMLLILTRFTTVSGVYDVIILLPSRDKSDKRPQPGCLRVADSQENIDTVNTNSDWK